ncbi:hypothetical protein [Sphaerotilus sp.]|uniref:hypothetical protein n=1 Tax=Sphaerotilus sp. TaxID=2093942 RepID=UPI002ACE3B2C|nr:hypothetical protein [Sphaerotilus sp.]MDZ7857551.1 hypothetical protein [Sphaerotilus sp.]
MHHAPALTLALQTDPLWRRNLRAGSVVGLLVVLGWLAWHSVGSRNSLPDWPMLAVATVSALAPLYLLMRSGAERPPATLCWLPAQGLWRLLPSPTDASGTPQPGRLDCMVAGQDWLLLRHREPQGPTTWIPVSRRAHQADWHALCCAVFSPGTSPPPTLPQADE